MTYVIADPCTDIKDRSCMQQCPVDCIYEGARALYTMVSGPLFQANT